jgi:hypothetical protein
MPPIQSTSALDKAPSDQNCQFQLHGYPVSIASSNSTSFLLDLGPANVLATWLVEYHALSFSERDTSTHIR